jgi:hypothetical protein
MSLPGGTGGTGGTMRGGNGITINFNGSAIIYAGGGGAVADGQYSAPGGTGGGGTGNGSSGTNNLGGGGGAGSGSAGRGGRGLVMLRRVLS